MSDKLRRAYRFTTVPEHLVHDKSVSDRGFRLWCILDRYAGKDDAAFPLRETLADDLACSRASVDRAIGELVEGGWLHKERRWAGGSNLYTLLIAQVPSKGKKAQVTEGSVLTDEDRGVSSPMSAGGVLTHDETPSAPVMTPVVTGDAHKEASLSEHQVSETSDDSLRSPSAEVNGQAALVSVTGDASSTRVTGKKKRAEDSPHWAQAKSIGEAWWEHYQAHFGKITRIGTGNPFIALVNNVILPALEADWTENEIKFALNRPATSDGIPDAVPDKTRFLRALVAVRSGVPAIGQRAVQNAHHVPETDADRQTRANAF